jgi:hypothetical protein
VTPDPTTAAIADQIADRNRLQGEVTRLAKALAEAYTADEVMKAECARLRALVEEACGELDDTGGEFAAKRATEIRQAARIEEA